MFILSLGVDSHLSHCYVYFGNVIHGKESTWQIEQ